MAATAVTETEAVWSVKCYCCGLTEECTPRYIDGVRERYQGRWICGLCAEAVKEEGLKLKDDDVDVDVDVSTDEALKRHMKFRSSTSSPPNKPTLDLILAMKHLLVRSLDSPRKEPLTFSPLTTSRTCFSPGSSKGEPQEARKVVTSEW
ncbi:hypothetical protein JHK82_014475 [Glycine max]|uniref:DUF1677 family protein n=4 Tax=Glycine subgen. Soja TaxID=1462606 RepID=K7KTB2_SOYBN|nr:uncharacterized protein LOC100813662 [Glycine max]XP_014632766.1 uncharacterized protein LOC100813662 [Glycine max]XP_028235103.1 uncharacterized protein LOC114414865 [Glycine soja]XP_028235104.1 uncharacterized protein LOC114414865 [Glycine soja]KAG5045097.1 hypothetical protein JHK86_014503 [Glycine max]KAG5147594.1 hypothetical protein JHK82_014475 [Glycine max]KHN32157.1 hypothetical protein glysoja_035250 [Glycine soja]KRH52271.1 hypothetical protein GLYMA_06G057500v4 [Glycine max]|eukprot:XP_014632765.1 uncharacterized protein LOC100813662 [Glycine max]